MTTFLCCGSRHLHLQQMELKQEIHKREICLRRKTKQMEVLVHEHDSELAHKAARISTLEQLLEENSITVPADKPASTPRRNSQRVRPSLLLSPNDEFDFHDAVADYEDSIHPDNNPMTMSQPVPVMTSGIEVEINDGKAAGSPNTRAKNMFTEDDTLPPGRDPDECVEGEGLNAEELDVLRQVQEIFTDCRQIGNELVTRTLRGYASYDNRVKDTAEAMQKIATWRAEHGMYTITSRKLEHHDQYHRIWPGYTAGEDEMGHVIHYEHIKLIDTTALVEMKKGGTCTLEHLLLLRSQFLEMMEEHKRRRSFAHRKRRYKEVMILNLDGFSLSLFSSAIKEIMLGSFGIGGAYYPDALHKMFIVNSPWVFRTVWTAVAPFIHPITKAKIKILGGESKYLPEMRKAGIPMTSIPRALGGTCECKLVSDLLEENFAAAAAAAAGGGGGGDGAQ